ncbi:MAG: ATP-dependent helicase, partial [Bacteroidales bacterium]|nr:ATP-dependent helicase [Bacteroidales bacterium]
YQEHFRYIMVDEYQDTNFAQYLIVKKLAAKNRNICVVGDDSQSIYSFRGANIQNILSFKADYPEANTIALEQNYRSTGTIVKLSNVLIENNKGRIPKTIWTQNDEGCLVKLLAAPTDEEEGRMVAQQIFETEMNERVHHKDFAILYRTNNQSKAMEDALRRINIPYRIYGGHSFYQRKEIKDMVAYFRWVANPRDEACLLRCINLPARGIGDTTIDRLRILASAKGCALFDAIALLNDPAVSAEAGLNGAAVTRLSRVRDMILSLNIRLADTDAYTLAADIWKHCGIEQEYKQENTIESEARLRNVEELLNAVQEFVERDHFEVDEETGEMLPYEGVVTLDRFLQEIALLTDMDEKKDDDEHGGDVVTLMTIHAAKGLEYPYVFVVGCEEDLFPSEMSSATQEDLEEERRLFYVAVTRSERQLFLSFARKRMRWGQRNDTKPSRFLSEIERSGCFENPQVLKAPAAVFIDDDEERGAWGGFGSFGGRSGGRGDYGRGEGRGGNRYGG